MAGAMKPDKYCPGCQQVLPRNAFHSKGKSKTTGESYLTTMCKACFRADYPNRREKDIAYAKQWNATHRDRHNATQRRYRITNPGAVRARRDSYALKSDTISDFISKKQWEQTLAYFGHVCAYCGHADKLEFDHFVPLILGGAATVDNLIPACRKCNAAKSDKHPYNFLPRNFYYSTVEYLFQLCLDNSITQ